MNIASLIKQTYLGMAPHMGEPNLTLFCQKPTGAFTTDSVGNRRPVYAEEIIQLSVREDREPKAPLSPDGTSIKAQPLLGRFVTPKLAPEWLNSKQRYKAELKDGASGFVKRGEFEFDTLVQHRSKEFSEVRGSLVKGLFVEIK